MEIEMFKKYMVWVFALFCLICHAEDSNQIHIQNVRVSPDGEKISFIKEIGPNKYLNVYNLANKKAIMSLDLANVTPINLMFVNNEKIYIMLSESQRISGFKGKNDISTGFIVDLVTKTTKQALTPGLHYVYPGQTGIGRLVGISNDFKSVFIPCYLGTTEGILGDGPPPPKYGLVKVDLSSNKKPKIISNGHLHTKDYFLDAEKRILAEERYDLRKKEHSIWTHDGKKSTEIFRENARQGLKHFFGITNDYKSLLFYEAIDDNSQTPQIFEMHLNTGETSVFKTNIPKKIISPIMGENRVVEGFALHGSPIDFYFYDKDLNQRVQKIISYFTNHMISIVHWSPDWKHIIVNVQGHKYQDVYFLVSADSDTPRYITAAFPQSTSQQ